MDSQRAINQGRASPLTSWVQKAKFVFFLRNLDQKNIKSLLQSVII